ncbi:MAG TPA: VacJ family lipoprotein [Rhizomicrobium sp.]|nr:VacJ family lipoprotein [Rhizomicrobium sp.]
MRALSAIVIFAAGLVLAGCATSPDSSDTNDPFENTNRQIFAFNMKLDRYIVKPGAEAYVDVVPEPARDGVHNFLTNLDLPVTFANDVLQGEMERAGETFGRFTVNSTIGIGGILDLATPMGIPYHSEDFGQTLGVYGVNEGPYLVLPFFGPDPPRDLTGQVVDVFLDPFTYVKLREHGWWSAGRATFSLLDLRSRNLGTLEGIERSSVDYYASVRSLYRQLRNSEIRNGKPDVKDLPSF